MTQISVLNIVSPQGKASRTESPEESFCEKLQIDRVEWEGLASQWARREAGIDLMADFGCRGGFLEGISSKPVEEGFAPDRSTENDSARVDNKVNSFDIHYERIVYQRSARVQRTWPVRMSPVCESRKRSICLSVVLRLLKSVCRVKWRRKPVLYRLSYRRMASF
ncbi:hypothetical protein Pla110_02130 [Polystyrenella longa]|uniref:Uncharacterized protein n=1 Tax=Polystyrenella longa TaxID=2528007 RepID=A0A518CH04_9PLAN|nr:hypothetical protein Pla110_02130 [Polystyrenella longa]